MGLDPQTAIYHVRKLMEHLVCNSKAGGAFSLGVAISGQVPSLSPDTVKSTRLWSRRETSVITTFMLQLHIQENSGVEL